MIVLRSAPRLHRRDIVTRQACGEEGDNSGSFVDNLWESERAGPRAGPLGCSYAGDKTERVVTPQQSQG